MQRQIDKQNTLRQVIIDMKIQLYNIISINILSYVIFILPAIIFGELISMKPSE